MGIIQILMDLYVKYDFLRTSSALNEKKKAYLDYIKEDVSGSCSWSCNLSTGSMPDQALWTKSPYFSG